MVRGLDFTTQSSSSLFSPSFSATHFRLSFSLAHPFVVTLFQTVVLVSEHSLGEVRCNIYISLQHNISLTDASPYRCIKNKMGNMDVIIAYSTNNGIVTGSDYAGGFVGGVSTYYSDSTTLTIMSSANKGSVSAKKAWLVDLPLLALM